MSGCLGGEGNVRRLCIRIIRICLNNTTTPGKNKVRFRCQITGIEVQAFSYRLHEGPFQTSPRAQYLRKQAGKRRDVLWSMVFDHRPRFFIDRKIEKNHNDSANVVYHELALDFIFINDILNCIC